MADHHKLVSFASRQHGIVSYKQLDECEFSEFQIRRRVQKGEWTQVSSRVISLIGPPTAWNQRVVAGALGAAYGGGGISHRPAGRIWGLRSVDEEIDVAIPYPRQLTLPGAIVHRSRDLLPTDITWVNGLPVTTPERTLCDYGLIFPEHEVERCLHHAISGNNPLVNLSDLVRMRERIRKQGRDGSGMIGRSIERLPTSAEETESGPEVLLLQICETYGVPVPARQLPIVVAGRRFRVDFAYPDLKVFIEIDGNATHDGEQIALDGGRQNLLVAAGWRPIRLAYRTMKSSPEYCAELILEVCDGFRGDIAS